MPRYSFYFPRCGQIFTSKKAVTDFLNPIRLKYASQLKEVITNQDDINALKDFIEVVHNDRYEILEDFDLEKCEFYVDKAEYDNTYCFYLRDKNVDRTRQFSITKLSPPKPRENISSLFSHLISNIKLEIKRKLLPQYSGELDKFDLCHKTPTFKDCVDEFIRENNLGSILDEIISENGSGYNVPIFNDKYKYLENTFIQYYLKTYCNPEQQYFIRPNPRVRTLSASFSECL
ncbi:hypothetical protein ACWIYZ_10885 [Ursidibacter arcticus]